MSAETAQMQAGRELDALVAERVMGWTGLELDEDGGAFGEPADPWGFAPYRDEFDREMFGRELVPRYSASIAAAWTVADALRARGFYVEIGCGEGFRCELWRVEDLLRVDGVVHVLADTAPLAICRAALAALGAP